LAIGFYWIRLRFINFPFLLIGFGIFPKGLPWLGLGFGWVFLKPQLNLTLAKEGSGTQTILPN